MESIRSLAGCGRGFFHSTSFRSRERYDRNGRTLYSHVPFLSVIIVITIEHRRASHSDWKKEGGKKCVETRRSIEAQLLRNTIHSITYVFIRQIGTKEQQARGNESLLPSRTGFEGYRVF